MHFCVNEPCLTSANLHILSAISTLDGNCSNGNVRLNKFSDSNLHMTRQGRLELCINSAWGTVCNKLFDNVDASVFCGELTGFSGEGNSALIYLWFANFETDN